MDLLPFRRTILKDPCSKQKDPGPCLGYFVLCYHDSEDNTCKTFVYGGCLGNDNRFSSLQECDAKCHSNSPFTMKKVDTQVNVSLATPGYKVNSSLQLDCSVSGTQPMLVSWQLGKEPLQSDERREILSNHTLRITSAQYDDSGTYVCEAQNQHGKASASIDIRVHDISVPSTCKDSPFFTSCAMIVKQNYCINPTYAKYCCLSCAIAGQLQNNVETVS